MIALNQNQLQDKSVTIVECRDHCAKSPESALVLSSAAVIVMDQIKKPKYDRFYFSFFFSLNNLTSIAMSHYWYSAYFHITRKFVLILTLMGFYLLNSSGIIGFSTFLF